MDTRRLHPHKPYCLEPYEWAYIAGFLDGEGTLSSRYGSGRVGIEISASQNSLAPLRYIQERLGGHVRFRPNAYGGQWIWSLTKRRAVFDALTQLRPYLIVKKEEADVALDILCREWGDGMLRLLDGQLRWLKTREAIEVDIETGSHWGGVLMTSVMQDWLAALPWKQQSILFSGLRGPDAPNVPNIKAVNRWARTVTQHNADPSKNYMRQERVPEPLDVCDELEFLPAHYVHHFADALAVIAYGHPDREIASYAARLHYRIAEELFHFHPEPPHVFNLRHRDKPQGNDPRSAEWSHIERDAFEEFIDAALERGT